MSKDTKDPHAPAAEAAAGANVNTGVAIVGFLLCFLAGVALMWGYDQHRLKGGEIAADTDTARRRVGRQRVADPHLEQGPDVGQARRAGHDRPVQRLPVPVLLARRADDGPGEDDLRPGQGPHRLEEQPPALPPEREARGRSGPGRLRARGQRRVLEVPRHGLQEPGRSRRRQLREVGGRRGRQGRGGVQGGPREPQVGRQGRQGPERRQGRRRATGPRRSSSTASSSTARSRSTTSRRRSTRSSRRRRRRSPRAPRSRASTSRCQGEQEERPGRREARRRGEGRHHDGVQGPRRAAARRSAARTRS